MASVKMSDQIAAVLDCHQYAIGYDGIASDGDVAWLQCICGWQQTYEMPEDNIRLAEVVWERHQAEMIAAHLGGE